MDPLSDVLGLMKPNSYGFRGLDAGGDWSLTFPSAEGVKCFAVHAGYCTIALDAGGAPTRLVPGDFVLLPGRSGFRLYSAADAPATDAYRFFPSFPAGETGVLNGGGDCMGVGGFFDFTGLHTELLLGVLRPILHIRAEETRAELGWLIARLMRELRDPQPGGTLIAGHLAQTLLIEALRLHLAERRGAHAGWLFALGDRQIGPVLAAMHAEPARRWALSDLARIAGMSRSSFAVRFKTAVGEPAMDYLTRWRMMLAADRLATGRVSIATVAPSVGYESESAFSAAFKRTFGGSPSAFARARGV
ncbi:AraC family transcriptional regulator [Brevundimonas sp. LM2]|uniref:AraC family transcriptional regulator n=1 Tax=Brevundimonas sp. LM2 TaxID=1938605 RepID=UPI000983FE7F|nr:AraC family transcriptional regulator [Brevundimonas sp. LM2]AQR63121.1 AraC family transcriptional regulator [Brevundimonas sp. LM2]